MATIPSDTGAPYRVPPEPRRWPSIALAAAVHLGLLAFLFIGINWQNNEPVAVEAEVWDMKTQAAAPPPPPPQEVEASPPAPAPTPPEIPQAAPRPVVEEPPAPKAPDIALEREKRKEQENKLAEQQREEARQEALREEKLEKEKERKKAEQLAAKKEKEKAKELAEQQAQALADKKAAQKKLDEKKLEEKKLAEKQKGEKLAKAKAEAAEQAKLDKLRDAEMKRMLAGVGGTGDAAKSTAPKSDAGYLAGIRSKVKSTTTYTGSTEVPGNPTAEFRIEQLPTGEIMNVKLLKSSGVGSFDNAVEKGIIKASPLPKKKDGTVERTLVIAFKMKDLN